MIYKLIRYGKQIRSLQRYNLAMTRAGAGAILRRIVPQVPTTWEFRGFSQHGEDGIIDYLLSCLRKANRYFIEIGCADGHENNTSWLALARGFSGLMIDGNQKDIAWCKFMLESMNYGLEFRHMFVTLDNLQELCAKCKDPDLISIDIDGNDLFVAEGLFRNGFRPKIWVVEYNSAFGPDLGLTIPYKADFRLSHDGDSSLYCGCSITAWKNLMGSYGYRFISVESCGVNAFFVDPDAFESSFVDSIIPLHFAENISHSRQYRTSWHEQFALIEDRDLVEVKR
jgi:hypothetical protein